MNHSFIDGTRLIAGKARLPTRIRQGVVLVGGCFDILHVGHITFLNKAKAKGRHLVVALESDDFIRTVKEREPFHSQLQRAEILLNIRSVDAVIVLPFMKTDEEYRLLVKHTQPSVIAVTKGDIHLSKKRLYAQEVGAKLCVVSGLLKGFSSSAIRTYAHIMRD